MSKIKPLLLLLFCAPFAHAQFTDVINSNRPGKSMGAFSVGRTVIQAELGFHTFREYHTISEYDVEGIGSDLQVRYGAFFEQLEFILDASYQNEVYKSRTTFRSRRDAGLKTISLGAKFLLYDPLKNYEQKPNLYSWKANHKFSWRAFIPAVGVYGGINIDAAKGKFDRPYYPIVDKWSPTLGLLTQNQFGRQVLCMNVMLDQLATQRESIDYVITLTHGFNMRWSGFIEHQGFVSEWYSDAIFRGGAAWLPIKNVQIDASIGANIKETPSLLVGGIGVSWRFDANYEDVYLRIPKEKGKESKEDKKKKKDKDKAKKRLDAIENGEPVKE
ncbi:transporter [Flavobacterium caeni]|uniref:Putative MetA-pathway of phenol degradation n=1 Tax=Flavobacterium caeni TaxID=490189 RepID=A0A1G5IXB6_9FLAO|nr:transporter [Flavobacterium caeni]SCY80722.1 Putative MetA-pathway of phenol degradation [Flavobacterium caeni]